MSINLVTIKETAIAEIVAATGSEQLIDKATRRNFVGLYDENTNWYIPLRANLGRKKPQGAVFDTPFKTTNPHFKRPGLDFQKAIYLEKDGVLPIRNTLPKEQSEFLEAHQDDVKRAFEQYILKVANHEMSDNQYFMSTPSLFPEGIEKIRQQVEQIVETTNLKSNLNHFDNYKQAIEAAYPDIIGEDGFAEPDFEGLDILRDVDEKKLIQIFSDSHSLPEFKALTHQAHLATVEEEKRKQEEWREQQLQEQFEEQEKMDEVYASATVDGDIWNLKTEDPIILGIETYEKYTVEYHPAFENNRPDVNVSTGDKDISFAKDEDGELIVAASYRVDDLSNDEKREMKEIAEFKINHPEKSMQEFSIMKLQKESKEQALHLADDGTKMFEFQFYDELIPGSYDPDKNTVKINFTARDTINYQHHQFVAEADLLTSLTSGQKIKLSTARFFENNKDISKNFGVIEWTESKEKFKITLPNPEPLTQVFELVDLDRAKQNAEQRRDYHRNQARLLSGTSINQNKEELKQELEQAITTKISDARASNSLIEVAKISGEIDTLEEHLYEVVTQSMKDSEQSVTPLSLQELIAQKDLKGIEEHIKSGIENYLDSETFKNYLDFALQFRQYSYRNKILIQGQNPKASLVAGYRAWQDKGRQVQRGEKALKIFVPNLAAKKDKDGKYLRDKEGNVIKEVKGFYLASVYDVRQTEGEPIPKPIYELEENINNPQKFDWYIKAITELSPVPIQFSEIKGTAKGFFVPFEKQITIRPGMSESQTIKTMLHEVTHSILHNNDVPVFGSPEYARQEIEAESVAYMVANSLGIETQDYSFGYLASWTDLGLSLENLEKSLDLICSQAQKMMGELDSILKQTPIEEQTQEIKPEQKQSNPRPKSSIKMHM
ncbi:ArdC-like ssDNA-binding domain-containing protein [Lactococcus lactis]|uniref:ArdC-like ssDNA-binding domain-containing protein n=1 Tax=Lactococcus lactis TaxID=1358 RepID=UPI0015C36653|nr:ArdC-like ssDNA-binding domain-containing protein [Lactococcus lactis]QLF89383.1 hypothetical protein HPC60_01050 [Lactococcus lactis subsp. lactis]